MSIFDKVKAYEKGASIGPPCRRKLCDSPPHLHLTTSKVMVIVWKLRGNIIRTVYIANVLSLQWAQLTKTVHTAR